jgi:hypothetical protein
VHPVREARMVCGFAVDCWHQIKPRKKADACARVDSVRNIIGHIRRKHDRCGQQLVSTKMLAHVLRGFTRQRVADHGIAVPERAEPFTVSENVRMKSPAGKINGRTYDPNTRFWAGWRLVDTYGDQTGTRKSEIVGAPDIFFTRADVQLVLDGASIADPTPEQWDAAVPGGSLVTVAVNVSKADFDGSKFGPNLVTSMHNPANPMSFATALIDYERLFPLRGAERRTAPLFTPDGAKRWTGPLIDSTLAGVMRNTLLPAERKGKTYHSKRVFVAAGLADLKSPDGEIQALCRWSSVESLRIYARMNMHYQAKRRDALQAADVRSLNANRRPVVDDHIAAADIRELADALDGAGAATMDTTA